MNYRSVSDLNNRIVVWLRTLPRDIDVVAGVPRSGLLVANLISLHRNLPMTDVEGLLEGRLLRSGRRSKTGSYDTFLTTPRTVLIVDDSVISGKQIASVREAVTAANTIHDIRYAAIYIAPGTEHQVDFHAEVVPGPRCFEWNLMHHRFLLAHACMDIDGVLCCDPDESQNDDGPRYAKFLVEAAPLYLPTYPVKWLVTSRLEKYRAATEAWLHRHGVEYGELVMMNYPDMAARQAARAYASYKADIYRRTGAALFIESHREQARQIAQLTGRSVFCMDTRQMMTPAGSNSAAGELERSLTRGSTLWKAFRKARKIRGAVARRWHQVFGKASHVDTSHIDN